MRASAVARQALNVSPVTLVIISYVLLVLFMFGEGITRDTEQSLGFLLVSALFICLLLPPLAICLSIWHLAFRRRIGECLGALVLALPFALFWFVAIRREMLELPVQPTVQADGHAPGQ